MNVTKLLASKKILDLSEKLIKRVKKSKGIDCYFNIILDINVSDSVLYYTIDGGGEIIYSLRHNLSFKPSTHSTYPSGDTFYDEYVEKMNKRNLETLKNDWDNTLKYFYHPANNSFLDKIKRKIKGE